MKDEQTPWGERRYLCRKTEKWLDDGKVREKREFFRIYRDDPERPDAVTRRERIVTFYTRLRGRHRLDNEIWYSTNDPAERERLRQELKAYLTDEPRLVTPRH
jgi:hypothetical protein